MSLPINCSHLFFSLVECDKDNCSYLGFLKKKLNIIFYSQGQTIFHSKPSLSKKEIFVAVLISFFNCILRISAFVVKYPKDDGPIYKEGLFLNCSKYYESLFLWYIE